ncbi:MAG: NAD-dependent epimerase/dehydratase family protein [Thermoguttaceae bacterium]
MIQDLAQLEDLLSRPTPAVVETMRRLQGDLIVLGIGGKIGPSLARMARRADEAAGVHRRILGVARFSSPGLREQLEAWGIETIACDLLDRQALASLPNVPNLLYLPAQKFGTTGQEGRTWAMNTYLAGMVCERFPTSRIVAYSTGNVYPLAPADSGGPGEQTPLAPVGEYGMSAMGRERIFSYFSEKFGIPVAIVRLNYAVEMRYGVLVDIAQKVLAGQPVDVTMGHFNVIWQGDSNAMTLRCFDHAASPPRPVNVTGLETLGIRRCAEEFADRMGKDVTFTGEEAADALLSDASLAFELFGPVSVDVEQMIDWIADWLQRGGPTHNKPTHFQARDGKF